MDHIFFASDTKILLITFIFTVKEAVTGLDGMKGRVLKVGRKKRKHLNNNLRITGRRVNIEGSRYPKEGGFI